MTARILVVDDIPANVKLLEARLLAEYFDVLTATQRRRGLAICEHGQVDIVLLDVMMPGMDGFEVCRRLKANPPTSHIPVVMVTALDQPSDRVRGLEAGADDFLTKPVERHAADARVRSLVRLKIADRRIAPARLDDAQDRHRGTARAATRRDRAERPRPPRRRAAELRTSASRSCSRATADVDVVEPIRTTALFQAAEGDYRRASSYQPDFAISTRCGSARRSARSTAPASCRSSLIAESRTRTTASLRGLELGVNDYLMRPVDQQRTARARCARRSGASATPTACATASQTRSSSPSPTALTGLHNRRYLDIHLQTLFDRAIGAAPPAVADDHRHRPLQVGQRHHGHDVGDEVLNEFARRLRKNVRGIDLACRFGGEEFVVVMPDTDARIAEKVAERMRAEIADTPFVIGRTKRLPVTVSVGVSSAERGDRRRRDLMKRADSRSTRPRPAAATGWSPRPPEACASRGNSLEL